MQQWITYLMFQSLVNVPIFNLQIPIADLILNLVRSFYFCSAYFSSLEKTTDCNFCPLCGCYSEIAHRNGIGIASGSRHTTTGPSP